VIPHHLKHTTSRLQPQQRLTQTQHKIAKQLAAAEDLQTPLTTLSRLAGNSSAVVRAAALRNPATPPAAVQRQYIALGGAKHAGDPAVRSELALVLRHPSCPAWVLQDAMTDPVWQDPVGTYDDQMKELAVLAGSHRNSPPLTVWQQFGPVDLTAGIQPDPTHRSWTTDRLRDRPWKSKTGSFSSETHTTLHWPDQVFQTMAGFEFATRECIAVNNNCPPDILRELATDGVINVVRAVANNPSCPPEVLQTLLQHQDSIVTLLAADNPALPRAALAMWQLTYKQHPEPQ
jgi:hypothetical protein